MCRVGCSTGSSMRLCWRWGYGWGSRREVEGRAPSHPVFRSYFRSHQNKSIRLKTITGIARSMGSPPFVAFVAHEQCDDPRKQYYRTQHFHVKCLQLPAWGRTTTERVPAATAGSTSPDGPAFGATVAGRKACTCRVAARLGSRAMHFAGSLPPVGAASPCTVRRKGVVQVEKAGLHAIDPCSAQSVNASLVASPQAWCRSWCT